MNSPASSQNSLIGSSHLLIAAVAWGGMYGVSKTALQYLDPYSMTTIRYGSGALIFCLLLLLKEGPKSFRFDGQFVRLWLYGSCGFCGFSILLFHGLKHAPAEHGAVIASLMPLISALISWLTQGKRPNKTTILCTLLAIFGVVLVISRGDISNLLQLESVKGDLMIIIGVTCWVIFSMGLGQMQGWSSSRYTALSCCAGLITILLANTVATVVGVSSLPTPEKVTPVLFEISYLILAAGVLAVSCWSSGVAKMGALNSLLFMNMIPVSAFIIAAVQGKAIHLMEIYGMTLVIVALVANNVLPRIQRADRQISATYR
ncbi:DMT family transporter [Amphritea balenae]|uniref:DMT family transporter n=1 Tax=Amphritea balenae TaxID=452629 RepID=A0A3P1SWL2_9GAMM|nr:DMT family transporter [Amphritea balenae]RRD01571.1 DMT family transporter [Amphritea balenae]GGK55816.1 transporter [Amphritea balenae]